MKRFAGLACVLLVLGLVAACERSPKSGRGFVFPEGDAARGKTAFIEMKCYTCHRVDQEVDIPAPLVDPSLVIPLGGEVVRVRTYGDLVTSIIHPDYAISDAVKANKRWEVKQTPMPVVNGTMTVQQLLDIVTFLQPHFHPLEPLYYNQYFTQ